MPQTTELSKAAPAEELALNGLGREEWLRARFVQMPRQECEWCFHGAALHEVEVDRYGEPTIICVTANGYRR